MTTTWDIRSQGYVLEVDHNVEEDFHQWVYIGDWSGETGIVHRDWLGREPGPGRTGNWRYFRVICNNTDCPARALVRVSKLERLVQQALPVPRRDS